MEFLQAIALGIVEGITEFLPISSTGHLMLFSELLRVERAEFLKTFYISIQFGAILAVVVLYWRRLFIDRESLKRVLIAFLPTGVIGFILYGMVRKYLLESQAVVIWSFFLGGIFLIIFELLHRSENEKEGDLNEISYKKCLLLGFFQALSLIPGVSRSAATIFGGLWLGIRRKVIVEFSFLLAVVTMLAATGYDLFRNHDVVMDGNLHLLAAGFAASFLVAILSIRFLVDFIKNHSFISFGIYRIAVALVFWFLVFD